MTVRFSKFTFNNKKKNKKKRSLKDFSLHKCREKLYPRKITYMTHNHIMVM